MERIHLGPVRFERGKCIKCGICVRICEQQGIEGGLEFFNRGFEMIVDIPFQEYDAPELVKIIERCAECCPTGALSLR